MEIAKVDNLTITVSFSAVNLLRKSQNQQDNLKHNPDAQITLIGNNQAEIRVESIEDTEKYFGVPGSVQAISPNNTWDEATESFKWFIGELGLGLGDKEIIAYDPYGFVEQFSDSLNIIETREHEWWRTTEGIDKVQKDYYEWQDDRRKEKQHPTKWRVSFHTDDLTFEGKTLTKLWAESDVSDPASLAWVDRFKKAWSVRYVDGVQHEHAISQFSWGGKKEHGQRHVDSVEFFVKADRDQKVYLSYEGERNGRAFKSFMKYRDDESSYPVKNELGWLYFE